MSVTIKIQGTSYTPEVILDPGNNIYEISGHSMLIDAEVFYKKISDWLNDNHQSIGNDIEFNLKFAFLSTSTLKSIVRVFRALEKINENNHNKITIIWHYEKEDNDMKLKGEEYRAIIKLPFKLKPY